MSLHPAVIQVLKSGRNQFNAQLVEARHLYPALDQDAFRDFLQAEFSDLTRLIAEQRPDVLTAFTVLLYEISLRLAGQGLLMNNAYQLPIKKLWCDVLPCYINLLAQQPRALLSLLINAMLHLQKFRDVDVASWLLNLQRMAAHISSLDDVRFAGQLLAWRAGVVHFREGVLHIAPDFAEITRIALQLPANTDINQWCANSLAKPWWTQGRVESDKPVFQRNAGAFSGWGGDFSSTPIIKAADNGFWVNSGERYFLLLADKYGAVLHAATASEFEQATLHLGATDLGATERPVLMGNRLRIGQSDVILDLPATATATDIGLASNAHSFALTSPYSHSIQIWSRS